MINLSRMDSPIPTVQHPEKYSKEFLDFISVCLQKDPTQRPSASELIAVRT
jgi:serine/threonine protein kinase